MESSELRSGNLVYEKYPSYLDYEVVDIWYIGRDLSLDYINPIPLTEEWLLKFGFNRHHDDYSNDVIFIKNVHNNTEFEWGVYPNELGSGIQIQNRKLLKYVHQLQNLYFALTGEELTLTDHEQ